MAPLHLPRVGLFPIFSENHPIYMATTNAELPLKIRSEFPLLGKQAPEINLPDHLGRRCSLHATMGLGRPIILFFFPLAGSPHCTKESCLFRDAIELTPIFNDLQAIVIGISQDPPERSKKFVNEHKLGYRILHDEGRKAMELYGVSRTMMGMVDMRSTFIIDPSGTVRGVAEGVLNSLGHLKFAEKWLIRLEHELSERSRKYLEYATRENDQIAGLDKETEKMIRVVYGEEGSASFGGIDTTPRYGAKSISPIKPTLAPKTPEKNSIKDYAEEDDSLTERIHKREKVTNGQHDKNMWKSWKYLLSQLSSPDNVPPPVVTNGNRGRPARSDVVGLEEASSPTGSVRSKKSVWSSKSNPTRTLSRRSRSQFNSQKTSRSKDSQAPPVPLSPHRNVDRIRNDSTDVDSDREGGTVWGTDASMESSLSTAPSSFAGHSRMRTGSLSSKALPSPVMAASSSPSIVNNGPWHSVPQQLAQPSVTSEVLMGDSPVVTRIIGNKVVRPTSTSSSSSTKFNSRDIALTQEVAAAGVPAPSSIQRLRLETPTPPRRSVGPSDVPEDAKPEDEEIVSLSPKRGPLNLQQNGSYRSSSNKPESRNVGIARPGSSESNNSSSRSTSATGRRPKRAPPPVVSSYHAPSWDNPSVNGNGRVEEAIQNSHDSELTIRAMRKLNVGSRPVNVGHQRSVSNQSQSSTEGIMAPSPSSSMYEVAKGKNVTATGLGSKQRNSSTPAESSLVEHASNGSSHQSIKSTNNSLQSLNGGLHLEEARSKALPKKVPPPMYPPPAAPALSDSPPELPSKPSFSSSSGSNSDHHHHHQQSHLDYRTAIISGVPISRSSITSSSPLDNVSPNNGFLASYNQSESRRPSVSESVRSNRTFG